MRKLGKTGGEYAFSNNKKDTVRQAKMIDCIHNSSRNIIQKIDFRIIPLPTITANSELVPGNVIDDNNSAVGFIKVGSGFGHSVVDLEHKDGGTVKNHTMDLTVPMGSPNVVIEDNICPGGYGRDHFGTTHAGNKFAISNATGNTLLNNFATLRGQHHAVTPYKLMKFNSNPATMNCATFAKLLAKQTALAIGPHNADYQSLRNIKAGSAFFGLKTPGHVAQ